MGRLIKLLILLAVVGGGSWYVVNYIGEQYDQFAEEQQTSIKPALITGDCVRSVEPFEKIDCNSYEETVYIISSQTTDLMGDDCSPASVAVITERTGGRTVYHCVVEMF